MYVCVCTVDMLSLFRLYTAALGTFAWQAPSRAGTVHLSLSPAAVGAPLSVGHSAALLSHLLVAIQPHVTPSASSVPACAWRSAFGSRALGLKMNK